MAAGENVVPHDVLAGEVDVERRVLRVVDEVVLDHQVRGAFVEIDAPAAVIVRPDMVKVVAADNRSRLDAEGVDAAHVAEDAGPDVVDEIVLDAVVPRRRLAEAPGPAGGDAGVARVV